MFISLALPSVSVKQELAMIGDRVEISYGSTTMIGIVTEGDPWLDTFGATWLKVEGIVNHPTRPHTSSLWVTDEAVLRVIR